MKNGKIRKTDILALRKLGIEEIEERLEASPLLPADQTTAACCGCTCEIKPISPIIRF